MKNIDHFMNFLIKDVFFLLHFSTKCCSIISLETLYNCFEKIGCRWKYIFVMISMNKKYFLFIHYVFQKIKTKKKTKNKQKILSSWTWFSERLLSFALNEKYLCLKIMFPEMKQTVSFIITTMVRLILFINFQYSINYMISKIIRK